MSDIVENKVEEEKPSLQNGGEETVAFDNMDELIENFSGELAVKTFKNGALLKWCEEMCYDVAAANLKELKSRIERGKERGERFSNAEVVEMIKTALGMETDEEKAAKEKLSQFTSDGELLKTAVNTAYNQRELARLIEQGCTEIQLCDGNFTIPVTMENMTYTVIGEPKVTVNATRAELAKKHITIKNFSFPDDMETSELFSEIAYDFAPFRFSKLIWLEHDLYSIERFNTKRECRKFIRSKAEAIYNEAARYLDVSYSKNIARLAAEHYSERMKKAFEKHGDTLRKFLSFDDFKALQGLCECYRPLLRTLEEEFCGDYYMLGSFDSYDCYLPDVEEEIDFRDYSRVGTLFNEVKRYFFFYSPEFRDRIREELNGYADQMFKLAYNECCKQVRDPVFEILARLRQPSEDEF